MQLPAFNETSYFINKINSHSEVLLLKEADSDAFKKYVDHFKSNGYTVREERSGSLNSYVAFSSNSASAYINYYNNLREMTIVTEDNTDYFDFSVSSKGVICTPEITQLHLEDFGMSYAIRLSDGRFIIIDGGREFEPDAMHLYECLKKENKDEKPIIAAWIFTHPHSDHFYCFVKFFDMYADNVIIERVMYNFPEHDDVIHYPAITSKDKRFPNYDTSAYAYIPLMKERVEKCGAKVYTPQTGQRYVIGDAICDVLASISDTIHHTKNINATSLVIRMELEGQVILWGADATFSEIHLPQKYGNFIKSDILQIPHHGFQSGTSEAEIAGYEVIAPSVCFLPVSDFNAYTMMGTYRDATRYLMISPDVTEIISGEETRTVKLPYTAPKVAKEALKNKYLSGRANAGSTTWVFSGLNTSNEKDFVFTILNMTNYNASVEIELFFENSAFDLRYIETEIPRISLKTLSIIGPEVNGDSRYFNWMSLKELGVPENVDFAVRFITKIPVVVSHAEHAPAYVSPMII